MIRNLELRGVAHQLRHYYYVAGLFSFAVNLLYLAGPIYMLQVYDCCAGRDRSQPHGDIG